MSECPTESLRLRLASRGFQRAVAQTFDGHWEVQVSSQRDSYDKTMLGIARAFPRLSSLGIAFRSDESCGPPPLCWCIGDEGLEALSRLKYLRSLHLPWCTGISPEVLAKVASRAQLAPNQLVMYNYTGAQIYTT